MIRKYDVTISLQFDYTVDTEDWQPGVGEQLDENRMRMEIIKCFEGDPLLIFEQGSDVRSQSVVYPLDD